MLGDGPILLYYIVIYFIALDSAGFSELSKQWYSMREEFNYPHNVCIEQGNCHIFAFEILHRSTANEELSSKRHVCTSESQWFFYNTMCVKHSAATI